MAPLFMLKEIKSAVLKTNLSARKKLYHQISSFYSCFAIKTSLMYIISPRMQLRVFHK